MDVKIDSKAEVKISSFKEALEGLTHFGLSCFGGYKCAHCAIG